MLKLLVVERADTHGWMYDSSADSTAQDEGDPPGVKSENVRWYVEAYFKARFSLLVTATLMSSGTDLR